MPMQDVRAREELVRLYRDALDKLCEADERTHEGLLARRRAKRALRRYLTRYEELGGQLTIDDELEGRVDEDTGGR